MKTTAFLPPDSVYSNIHTLGKLIFSMSFSNTDSTSILRLSTSMSWCDWRPAVCHLDFKLLSDVSPAWLLQLPVISSQVTSTLVLSERTCSPAFTERVNSIMTCLARRRSLISHFPEQQMGSKWMKLKTTASMAWSEQPSKFTMRADPKTPNKNPDKLKYPQQTYV